jgi:hypothetical protein
MTGKKIPGIYNYCDRWCERCYFASRCAVYEQDNDLTPEEKDLNNKAFWDRLAQNFVKAHKLLEEAAEKHGVNLQEIAQEIAEGNHDEKKLRRDSENHPIAKISWDYSVAAGEWMKTQPGMIEKLEELKQGLEMGTADTADARAQTEMIKDCLEVIQWYETFIHVKFMRALMGKMNDDDWEEENGFQRDFDGSAKIAMLGIERSMHAWLKLYDFLPDQEDEFLRILAMLERAKNLALQEFPRAMAFVRPGFDE